MTAALSLSLPLMYVIFIEATVYGSEAGTIISILLYFVAPCLEMPKVATGGVRKKRVLISFGKFTGKHLCQSLFF